MSPNADPFDDYTQLLELVAFASRKEAEAAQFYRDMTSQIESPEVSDEVKKLALMEEGHKDRLETLNVAVASSSDIPKAIKLSSSDYETPGAPTAALSLRQLIEVAIGREIAAWKLYSDMANLLPESMMKRLLLNLASEEVAHRQYLERLVRTEK